MTITAVDAVVADVVFVTELDRLLTFEPLSGVPRRAVELDSSKQRRANNEYRAVNGDLS